MLLPLKLIHRSWEKILLAQMKAHEEEKLKKDKAITCLHDGLADHIFTKIMDLETPKQVWDKIQDEFEGNDRSNLLGFSH